jgi:hypothetical protein
VALALSTYMNMEGGSAFPGARRLAHDTGRHERTVRRHLGRLVADEWLAVVERGGVRGEHRPNRYQALIPNPWREARGASETPGVTPGGPLAERALPPGVTPPKHLIEQPIGTSQKREREEKSEDQSLDALTSRCFKIFAPNGASEHDCVVAIDQLRDENIADSIIDMALVQCDGNGHHIHYLAVVARNWYAQRTGRPS